jgi:MFS family permease
MQTLAAQWQMSGLTTSALLIALISAANSLAIFALIVPGGVLADILSRRRLLMVTNGCMFVTAIVLATLTFAGVIQPGSLLLLVFVTGLFNALTMPGWQAMIPDLVARDQFSSAVTLNGVSTNVGQAAGPALGGVVVAFGGPGAVYLINAASFLAIVVVLWRRAKERPEEALPAERFFGAVRGGLRYVRFRPELRPLMIRVATFGFCASSLFALLPVYARQHLHVGSLSFGVMMAFLGIGGVGAVFLLPRLGKNVPRSQVVSGGMALLAVAVTCLALNDIYWVACAIVVVAGAAWLTLFTTYQVAATSLLPSWVRARALSVYLMALFGGLSAGAAIWGSVASRFGVTTAYFIVAGTTVVLLAATWRLPVPHGRAADISFGAAIPFPMHEPEETVELEHGPVVMNHRYVIDPRDTEAFLAAMAELGAARRRRGAIYWAVYRDLNRPHEYVETMVTETWADRLRLRERVGDADLELYRRALSFDKGGRRPEAEEYLVAAGGR